jgi:ribosome-associated toxin RatA of RatAB toxin-antitoxin module
MPESGSASIDIDASGDEIFDIVVDLEAYPEWVQGMKAIEIHERTKDGLPKRVTQTIDAGIKTVTYTLTYDYEGREVIRWTSEPGGDVKLIEGSYTFDMNDDGSTNVSYELTIDPGFPVPGFMIRKATKTIIGTALDGLKARAEGE